MKFGNPLQITSAAAPTPPGTTFSAIQTNTALASGTGFVVAAAPAGTSYLIILRIGVAAYVAGSFDCKLYPAGGGVFFFGHTSVEGQWQSMDYTSGRTLPAHTSLRCDVSGIAQYAVNVVFQTATPPP